MQNTFIIIVVCCCALKRAHCITSCFDCSTQESFLFDLLKNWHILLSRQTPNKSPQGDVWLFLDVVLLILRIVCVFSVSITHWRCERLFSFYTIIILLDLSHAQRLMPDSWESTGCLFQERQTFHFNSTLPLSLPMSLCFPKSGSVPIGQRWSRDSPFISLAYLWQSWCCGLSHKDPQTPRPSGLVFLVDDHDMKQITI